jgi:hypothetical protein
MGHLHRGIILALASQRDTALDSGATAEQAQERVQAACVVNGEDGSPFGEISTAAQAAEAAPVSTRSRSKKKAKKKVSRRGR